MIFQNFSLENLMRFVGKTFNLNTTQVFTVSSFEGNIARASILRGSYAILVEGTAQYHDASGKTYIRMFRASTDYVGLEKEGHNEAMLNIIWM